MPLRWAASQHAIVQVPSVLALSAIVIRAVNGNAVRRYWWRRATLRARSHSSLWTGMRTDSLGGMALGRPPREDVRDRR